MVSTLSFPPVKSQDDRYLDLQLCKDLPSIMGPTNKLTYLNVRHKLWTLVMPPGVFLVFKLVSL